MSDSDFGAVACRLRNAGMHDELWIKDSLSDDEIDVPKDIVFINEEDEDEEEENGTAFNANEIWGDLGLDGFLEELASLNSAPLQLQPLGLATAQGRGGGGGGGGGNSGVAAASATGGGAGGSGAQAAAQVGSAGAATPRGI
jgi:hypothetical protein